MFLASLSDWWTALSNAEQIYWAIALVATIIFLIQLIVTFIGLDADLEGDIDDGTGIGLISFRTLIAFATFFGWGGVVALNQGFSASKALMIAFLFGFLAMVMLAFILAQLFKMQESGTVDTYNAIAKVGKVYIPIPAGKEGLGKIQIELADKIMEFDALTEGEMLQTGAEVKVLDVINVNTMLVRAI